MPSGLVRLANTDPLAFFRAVATGDGLRRLRFDMAATHDAFSFTYDVRYDEANDCIAGMERHPEGTEWTDFSIDCRDYVERLLSRARTSLVTQVEKELIAASKGGDVRVIQRLYEHRLSHVRANAEQASAEKGRDILIAALQSTAAELDDLFNAAIGPGSQPPAEQAPDSATAGLKAAENDGRRHGSDEKVEWCINTWDRQREDPALKGATIMARYANFEARYADEFGPDADPPSYKALSTWVKREGKYWGRL